MKYLFKAFPLMATSKLHIEGKLRQDPERSGERSGGLDEVRQCATVPLRGGMQPGESEKILSNGVTLRE